MFYFRLVFSLYTGIPPDV